MQVVNTQAVQVTPETYAMVAATLGLSFMTQPMDVVLGGYLVINMPDVVWNDPQPRRSAYPNYSAFSTGYRRAPRAHERENITLVNRYFSEEEFDARFKFVTTGPGVKPKDKFRSIVMTKSEAAYLDEKHAQRDAELGEQCMDDDCSCINHRNA